MAMSDAIEIDGTLSREEAGALRRLLWGRFYWLSLFNNYVWRRFFRVMLCVMIGTIVSLWAADHLRLNQRLTISLICVLSGGVLAWLVRRHHGFPESMLRATNERGPRAITLSSANVRVLLRDGMETLVPWDRFRGWSMGPVVAALDLGGDGNLLPLPMRKLPENQRELVRSILRASLGEPSSATSVDGGMSGKPRE
jgi:hypothetical protein